MGNDDRSTGLFSRLASFWSGLLGRPAAPPVDVGPCPECGSSNTTVDVQYEQGGTPWNVKRCLDCRHTVAMD